MSLDALTAAFIAVEDNADLLKGPQGDKGDVGPKGDTGDQGPVGVTGLDGNDGADGAEGKPGPKGPKGGKGDKGEIGPKGERGPAGPAGSGRRGNPGYIARGGGASGGGGGGGGAVDSVNGQTGVVVLDAGDVGADADGVAAAAVTTHAGLADPHPGYLTPAEGNAAYDAIGAAAAAQSAAATDATTKANAAQAAAIAASGPASATYLVTTASAGLSAEVVVPAAVLTVLDDTTVAAMVDTLGGASSTGTGGLVRATSAVLVTPALGTPASGVATNLTGTAAGLTAGTVTTNANLTGDVTSSGNATTIGSGKVTEAMQVLADNTTQDVSTSKHGYVPKAPGDATKFLNGANPPVFAVPGGGGGLSGVLETHTANNTSTVLDFVTFISGTYTKYLIVGEEIALATNTATLQVKCGTGGTPTYDSGNNYEWVRIGVNTAGSAATASGSTGVAELFASMSNNAGYGIGSFSIVANALQSTAHRRTFFGTSQYVTSVGPASIFATWGMQYTAIGTALTALRFISTSGNILGGTISIYGFV